MINLLISIVYADQLKVAIIDTGLNLSDKYFTHLCMIGHKDLTGTTLNDIHGHGTHIAGIIQRNAGNSNYCMMIYKYYLNGLSGPDHLKNEIAAIKEAIKNKANIINISGGGAEGSKEEKSLIESNPEIIFVVSAGNEGKNIREKENEYYPASYFLPNEIVVGNGTDEKHREKSSGWGIGVVYENGIEIISNCIDGKDCTMSGTSMSAAVRTSKLIKQLSK